VPSWRPGPSRRPSLDLLHLQSWNDCSSPGSSTATASQNAPVFLTSFVTSQGLFLAKVCAAAVVVSLPVLIAGFAAQDKLVQGLSLGAIK
jgi:sorbitol/mannitol transport system permease protein